MASLNLNKVILAGHLTATPELRKTPGSGVSVTSFSIAVNRRFSKSSDGTQNATANVDYINCVAWRNTADFITRYFKKGSAICVSGRIEVRTWEDKNGGGKRYATEVNVDEVYFVDSTGQGGTGFAPQGSFESAPQFGSAPVADNQFEDVTDDDGLPF